MAYDLPLQSALPPVSGREHILLIGIRSHGHETISITSSFFNLCHTAEKNVFVPPMSRFYICTENRSIIGRMDPQVSFHREHADKNHTHGEVHDVREKHPLDRREEKPGFNPNFQAIHDLSDQNRQNDLNNGPPSSPYHTGRDGRSNEDLHHTRRDNSNNNHNFTLTPEIFEKMYLNPQQNVKGDLRSTFGNPTPLALLGFLLSLSPLACELMGWRGAGGDGIATVGAYYFIGGFLMSLGGILEFFLGNTFSFVVFCSFGGFWFTLGATLTPAFGAYAAYAPDPTNPAGGLSSPGFHASYGFFLLFMGLLSFMYLVCALRTNIVFVAIFTGLTMVFVLLTGSYWSLAANDIDTANKLQVVAGAFGLMAVLAGWWIFFAQMLASVDFPIVIPVGDISHLIKPLSARQAKKEGYPEP